MTEAEWLASTDPQTMLELLRDKASDRKLRLFAVASCRRIWHLLTDEKGRKAVEAAEQYADGLLNKEALAQASFLAYEVFDTGFPPNPNAYLAAEAIGDPTCISVADNAICAADIAADASRDREAEKAAQINLLRCIFGNLFCPITLNPAWLTWQGGTISKFAKSIYDERAFDQLPILADALEEAGCTDADILNHCRQPGEHVRGCWVVDLLLGKS